MAELGQPTKRIYVEILGGELDGLLIDVNQSTPIEQHIWAMLENLGLNRTIQSANLLSVLSLLQNPRQKIGDLRMTEEYIVVAREENDRELLMQLRQNYLPRE